MKQEEKSPFNITPGAVPHARLQVRKGLASSWALLKVNYLQNHISVHVYTQILALFLHCILHFFDITQAFYNFAHQNFWSNSLKSEQVMVLPGSCSSSWLDCNLPSTFALFKMDLLQYSPPGWDGNNYGTKMSKADIYFQFILSVMSHCLLHIMWRLPGWGWGIVVI